MMRDLFARLLATDDEKIKERKERIQHPHHVKSKSHWDWDSGYYDPESPITKDDKNITK